MFKKSCNLFRFNHSYLAICWLCLSLGMANPAIAEYEKQKDDSNDTPNPEDTGVSAIRAVYEKPKNQSNDAPNSQSTGVAAIRGTCNLGENKIKANSATLTTLAPYGHIGQSASTNPTFTWYVPDRESYPVEFSLSEVDPASYQGKGKQIYQTRLSSSAGIMTHSLPTEVSLVPGQTYIWQVAIICNPNSPSQSLVVNNRIEIVEKDPTITSQLNSTFDPVTKANTYVSFSLWYDALAEIALLEDPQARDATIELISQLATIEGDSNNLRQIVNSLQQSE